MSRNGVQIISADMKFSADVGEYMRDVGLADKGQKYHVVSIIGGQSSGKSTLLNAMFGTSFDMMDPTKGRQQTTKGIWCSVSTGTNILVMDVEGTDGREKEDQKAFEGKSALFSLALTDVMMINMWMHEVHLKLLHGNAASTSQRSRPLLLFILRDCDGRTGVESLKTTILKDLNKIWADMTKPDHFAESSLEDFFEVQCVGLPHFVYQADDWQKSVRQVATRFQGDGDVFNGRNSKDVPAEGWAHYAEQLWKTIQEDGDLDLPSQRKMLSMVRCDSKRKKILDEAQHKYTQWIEGADEGTYRSRVEEGLNGLKAEFDEQTAGYDEEVRKDAKAKLDMDVWPLLQESHDVLLRSGRDKLEAAFAESLRTLLPSDGELPAAGVSQRLRKLVDGTVEDFRKLTESITPTGAPWRERVYEQDGLLDMLHHNLSREEADAKKQLAAQVKETCQRELSRVLSRRLVPLLDEAPLNLWEEVRAAHRQEITQATDRIKAKLTELGMWAESEEENVRSSMRAFADQLVDDRMTDKAGEQSLSGKLFHRFDMLFNRGRGRLWRLWDNPDHEYVKAHQAGLALLDVFCVSRLYDEGAWPTGRSAVRYIDEDRRDVLAAEFEAQARQELVWAQVTRSNSSTHSSMLVGALVLVLGWNEIMWLLGNPLYLFLIVAVTTGAAVYYFLHRIGDWNQLLALVLRTIVGILNPSETPHSKPSGAAGTTPGGGTEAKPAVNSFPRQQRPVSLSLGAIGRSNTQ